MESGSGDALSLPAGRDQQTLHEGTVDQRRLHAVEGREHGGRRRRRRDVQLAEPVRPQHGAGGLRPDAQLPRGRRLSAAVAEQRRQSRQHRRAIVNDWQINGTFAAFSGTPFTVTANGNDREHAGQPADGRSGRRRHPRSVKLARRAPTTTRRRGCSRRASASATRDAISSVVRAESTSTCRSSGRSPWVARDGSSSASRRRTSPTRRSSSTRPATSTAAASCASLGTFGTATSGAYFERQIRFGLRFSF